jgi:hypothetical protein
MGWPIEERQMEDYLTGFTLGQARIDDSQAPTRYAQACLRSASENI